MRAGKDIAITHHAVERLKQRFYIGKKSLQSIVRAAWFSCDRPSESFYQSKYNLKNYKYTTYHYRKYKGYIFCFQKKLIDTVLLTVFYDDTDHYQSNAAYTKKAPRGYFGRSFLQDMYPPKNPRLRRKNNPRARRHLRREAGE